MKIERIENSPILKVTDDNGKVRWTPNDPANSDFRKNILPRLAEAIFTPVPKETKKTNFDALIDEMAYRLGTSPEELRSSVGRRR